MSDNLWKILEKYLLGTLRMKKWNKHDHMWLHFWNTITAIEFKECALSNRYVKLAKIRPLTVKTYAKGIEMVRQ